MSNFDFPAEPPLIDEHLPWDVQTDRATGLFAFVNMQSRLKILIIPPDAARKHGEERDDQWMARLIDERPHATRVVAVATTEIGLIEKLEEVLESTPENDR